MTSIPLRSPPSIGINPIVAPVAPKPALTAAAAPKPAAPAPAVSPTPTVAAAVTAPAPAAPVAVVADAPRVRKALIPIAGDYARLWPASRACAAAMLPIVDVDSALKPILEVIIEEVLTAMEWKQSSEQPTSTEADAAASSAPASEISIAIVVRSEAQRQQVQDYFSAAQPAPTSATLEQIKQSQRLEAIGKLLHFVVQEKPLVRS